MVDLLLVGTADTARLIEESLQETAREYRLIRVDVFSDVRAALLQQSPALVLCELSLGEFTVLDVIALVRQQASTAAVLPLAVTGGESLALQCIEAGIEHCIVLERAHLARLPALLRLLLKRSQAEQQRQAVEARLRESEQRYQDIVDNTSDLIQCLAPDGSFLYTNRAWRETLGYSEAEVASLRLADVLHPDSMLCCQDRFERLKQGTNLSRIEFKFISKQGETIHLSGECGSIIKDGQAVSTRGIFRNITEKRRAEAALQASEARYQSLYENAPDIYSTVNARGEILSVNRIGAAMLGYEVEELIGRSAMELIHPPDRERVQAYLGDQFEAPVPGSQIEYRKIRKDGSILWVQQRASLSPLEDSGHENCLLLVCRDITETRQLSEQLAYQAAHDELTDLVNRREFERRLGRLLATNHPGDARHALCYLDLDQFKVINDTCGHIAGDELLRQISRLLMEQIRSRDTLARLGGDEFAVLMEHCPLEQAEQLADLFRQTVEDFRFHWRSRHFSVGVSIGIVPIEGNGKSMQQLLSLADSACYAAKERGRNRVYVCQPDDAVMDNHVGEMHWASDITQALEKQKFCLFAQPIVPCLEAGGGERFEILLRLREPSGEIIMPGAFLPAAERYNLSTKIDRWVLESVLNWFDAHQDALDRLDMCSINLSGLSLGDQGFQKAALRLLGEGRFPHHKLCFEITETAAISNLSRAIEFMDCFKRQGCRFALDDFGSGLSSFGYLKNLPVDFLKIDGAFVRDIANNDIDRAMVKSISEVASLMDKKTTAEYVESREAFRVLRELGVDYAQGYYLGQPAPLEDVAGLGETGAQILNLPR